MRSNDIKVAAAALWVIAVGAVGLLADVTSLPVFIGLVGCATVPPLILARYWNHPAETTSESIQRIVR